MPRPVRTLGYPSMTAAILSLREDGKKTGEIAAAVGIPPARVTALELCAQRTKARRTTLQLDLPEYLLPRLAPHAIRRGMTSKGLAIRILEAALDDNLVDAVLDDRCDGDA